MCIRDSLGPDGMTAFIFWGHDRYGSYDTTFMFERYVEPVSYTHLDVYKRQSMSLPKRDGVNDRYYLIHKPDTSPEVLAEADLCIQDVLNGTCLLYTSRCV